MVQHVHLHKMSLASLMSFTTDYNDRLNVSQNMRKSGRAYAWSLIVLRHMEATGLIRMVEDGRDVFVEFTDEGEILRRHINEIHQLISRAEKRLKEKP